MDSQPALGFQQALKGASSCAVTGAGKQGRGAFCREGSGEKACFERAGWGIRYVVCSGTTPRGQKGLEGTRIFKFVLCWLLWKCDLKTRTVDTFILAYFQWESTKEEKHQKRINRAQVGSPLLHGCLEPGESGLSSLPGCFGWVPWK